MAVLKKELNKTLACFFSTLGTIPSFLSGDRIVGGQDAAAPIPWQVRLFVCLI